MNEPQNIVLDMEHINLSDKKQENNTENFEDKKNILLVFINKILININGSTITNLTDFVNIDKDDIIKDENKKLILEFEKDFFHIFDKKKFGWSRRNCTKNYILTFIRYACNEVNLDFKSEKKNKYMTINGIKYHKTCMIYNISNKKNT